MSLLLDTRSGIVCQYIDSTAENFHHLVTMAPLFGSGSVTRDSRDVLVLPPNVVPFTRSRPASTPAGSLTGHAAEPGEVTPVASSGNPFSPSIA
jgi:hypothetical protein